MVTKMRCVLASILLASCGCGRDIAEEISSEPTAVSVEVFLLHSVSNSEQRKKLLQKYSSEEVATWDGDRLLRELKSL